MSKFKALYNFTFPKVSEKEETQSSVNEAGDTVTVSKKVPVATPVDFALLKPSRNLHDEGELFYNVTVSKGVQAGLMPAALVAKRFVNDGGVLSEPEKEEWAKKYMSRVEKEIAVQKLNAKVDRSDEDNNAYKQLVTDISVLNRELQDFEIRQQSIFDISAEARARTKTIFWWLLQLLHIKNEKGEFEPFFKGDKLEDRQAEYDELDNEEVFPTTEEREFNQRVVGHAIQATALWYYGRAATHEALKKALEEQTQ